MAKTVAAVPGTKSDSELAHLCGAEQLAGNAGSLLYKLNAWYDESLQRREPWRDRYDRIVPDGVSRWAMQSVQAGCTLEETARAVILLASALVDALKVEEL